MSTGQAFENLDFDQLIAEVEAATAVEPLPREATSADITGWIRRRIARELKIEPERVDPEAPLAEMGVASIAALGMTGDLAEALGRELPDTLLWDHPTVSSVARFLGSDVEEEPDRIDRAHRAMARRAGLSATHYKRLFDRTATWGSARARPGFFANVIAAHPGTIPIFWVGDYKGSHPLASALETSVYAQPSGYRLLRHSRENVEALARVYAWEIRQLVEPGSPFVLAGYCFGGKLTLEIARRLHRQRAFRPSATVLVECPGPSPTYWKVYRGANRLVGERSRERAIHHLGRAGREGWFRHAGGLASRAYRRHVHDDRPRNAMAAPAVIEETTTHWEYRPAPVRFPVVQVFAEETRYRLPGCGKWGWGGWLRGPVRWRLVPGDHFTVIEPMDVGHLAEVFREVMAGGTPAPRGGRGGA